MRRLITRFVRQDAGTAAIEFAAVGSVLILGTMTAVDVGRYAFQTAEVSAAAQAGAQAAFVACDVAHTPATINCTDLNAAVTTAIQTSRLGDQVKLDGAVTEGYYCLDAKEKLQFAGPANAKPTNCSGIYMPAASAVPTLYLQVPVTSAFQPLFPGITLAQSFVSAIKRTAWMRMA